MNDPNYKGIELLPLSVIEAARAGDAEAVERVLRYYSGYMNKLCTRRHFVVTIAWMSLISRRRFMASSRHT